MGGGAPGLAKPPASGSPVLVPQLGRALELEGAVVGGHWSDLQTLQPLVRLPLPSLQSSQSGSLPNFSLAINKTPSFLLPFFSPCLLPISHYSLFVLIPSPPHGTDSRLFSDHHLQPRVLIFDLTCLPEATEPSFVSTAAYNTALSYVLLYLPTTPPQSCRLIPLQNVPRPGSRVLAAQLESPTQLYGLRVFPPWPFHVESRRQNCLPDIPSLPTYPSLPSVFSLPVLPPPQTPLKLSLVTVHLRLDDDISTV